MRRGLGIARVFECNGQQQGGLDVSSPSRCGLEVTDLRPDLGNVGGKICVDGDEGWTARRMYIS